MAKTVGLTIAMPTEAEKYICPHCGKEYRSEAGWKTHMREKHPEQLEHPE